MPLLDRYFFKHLFIVYAVCLFSLTGFYVIVDLISHLSRFDLPTLMVLNFFIYKIPSILVQMMSVSVFLTILISYTHFAQNRELTAMAASGISTWRIYSPAISLALAIASLHIFLNDQWASRSLLLYKHMRTYVHNPAAKDNFNPLSFKQNNVWLRTENKFLNILSLTPESTALQGITIYEVTPDFRLQRRIQAKEARLENDAWTLLKGVQAEFPRADGAATMSTFDQLPAGMIARANDLKEIIPMTQGLRLSELRRFILRNKKAGVSSARLSVEFHSRIAFSFSCLLFAVLALPFCTKAGRHQNIARNVLVCFLCVASYWILFNFCLTIGNSEAVPAWFAAWAANGLFAAIAGGLLYKFGTIR